MINIDSLSMDKQTIYGEECIIRPETLGLVQRIKDAYRVLTGHSIAVAFTEDINLKPIIDESIYEIIYLNNEFYEVDGIPESISSVLETKLNRELYKVGVEFDGNHSVTIKKYRVDFLNRKLKISLDGVDIDVKDNKELGKFYESTKFKYICGKIITIFKDIEKSRDYMSSGERKETIE
jgi:hypothetical protein